MVKPLKSQPSGGVFAMKTVILTLRKSLNDKESELELLINVDRARIAKSLEDIDSRIADMEAEIAETKDAIVALGGEVPAS